MRLIRCLYAKSRNWLRWGPVVLFLFFVWKMSNPHSQLHLLIPNEWGLGELDLDGTDQVTICHRFGFFEVRTTSPR